MDGTDLASLLNNPSLCPALRSPERRIALAVGKLLQKVESKLVPNYVIYTCHTLNATMFLTTHSGIAKGMSHLHNLRVPIVHGDFKASDVLVEVNTHQVKITNFGLHDFKGFMIRATLPGMCERVVRERNSRSGLNLLT